MHLAVDGIGLSELTGPYDSSPSVAETALPTAVSFLVIAPLINAICIHAIHSSASGTPPRAREALQSGLDAFAPIFLAVVLAGIGIAAGLVLLVVPGVYLAVRWYLVPQAVVIDGARGLRALRRSGELVQGFWWRTFGLLVAANLAAVIPGLVLVTPFEAIASSAGPRRLVIGGHGGHGDDHRALRGAVLDAPLLRPARAPAGALAGRSAARGGGPGEPGPVGGARSARCRASAGHGYRP